MTYHERGIVLEDGEYFVLAAPKGRKGFEVYRNGITHATRCASIGYDGEKGIERCRAEIARRKSTHT